VASITAFHLSRPAAMFVSIWSMRMTEFRMIMPLSAMMPRIATKPNGVPVDSNAATTPISPNGATLTTRNSRWKLCNWTMRMLAISSRVTGNTAATEAWPLALASSVPPASIA
jgi:hypothetical protein